jgi:murein DD-endopeptidase MepM/ murein hydrolase activator NlpD
MRRLAPVLGLVLLLAGLGVPPAAADLEGDLASIRARIDGYRSQIEEAAAERTELAAAILETGERLDELTAGVDDARADLQAVDGEISRTEREIVSLRTGMAERDARLEELRLRLEAVKDAAVSRAIELYMAPWAGGAAGPDASLDAAASVALVYAARVQRLADRDIEALETLRALERRERAALEREGEELEMTVAALLDRRAERETAAGIVEDRLAEAAAEMAEQQALLAEVDAVIDEIEGEIASLSAEQDRVRTLISSEQSTGGRRPGALYRPVPGGVSSWYGYRIHPIYGDRRLHTGLDMNAGCGEPIRAAAAGRVFLADWKGGYGLTVMIDHGGGMSTMYAHQSSAAVGYGQQVGAGQVIGYIGSTGTSTACHLHFEVRIGGNPVDPAPYL